MSKRAVFLISLLMFLAGVAIGRFSGRLKMVEGPPALAETTARKINEAPKLVTPIKQQGAGARPSIQPPQDVAAKIKEMDEKYALLGQITYEAYVKLLSDSQGYANYRLLKRRQAEENFRPYLMLLGIKPEKRALLLDALAGYEMDKLEFKSVTYDAGDLERTESLKDAQAWQAEKDLETQLKSILAEGEYTALKSFKENEPQWNGLEQFNRRLEDPSLALTRDQVTTMAEALKERNLTLTKEGAESVLAPFLTEQQAISLGRYLNEERMLQSAWAEDDKIKARLRGIMGTPGK